MSPCTAQLHSVLVVEDDPWTRSLICELLSVERYHVLEAKNGEDGLRLAHSARPSVVLLDLALPTKSGLEVLRELRADPATRDIPVIVVSAYGDLMSAHDADAANAVLKKPFDLPELLDAVERAALAEPVRDLALV